MRLSELDRKIKDLRKEVRSLSNLANLALANYETQEHYKLLEKCYESFESLDKLQRTRYSNHGSFLPVKNGKVFTYDPELDLWISWSQ